MVQAIDDAKPDAIFSVLFGADLAKFVREGSTRGMFKDRVVVDLLGGEPEYLDPLKDEAPVGWIVTGYPWYAIEHAGRTQTFLDAYQKKFNDYPRLGSVVGYVTDQVDGRRHRQGGLDRHRKLVDAFAGLKVDSPFGPFTIAAATTRRPWAPIVGKLALKDGRAP